MKQKYLFLFTLLVVFAVSISGQNKIGNNPSKINGGSLLELESTSKGLLLPRIPLDDATKWTLDGVAVNGMLIFADGTGAEAKGIYYWNSTNNQWIRVINSAELPTLIANYTTVSNSISGNKLKTTVNGKVSDEVSIISAIQNTLSGSSLTTTVNGIDAISVDLSPIVAANTTNTFTAASGKLTSTVNGHISDLTPDAGVVAKTLGFDATGKLVNQDAGSVAVTITNDLSISGNTLTSNVNNVSKSANVVNGFNNSLSGSSLTTTINGIGATVDLSPILTTSTTNALAGTGNKLTSTVNGKAADLIPASGTISKSLGFDASGNLVVAGTTPTTNTLTATNGTLTSTVNSVASSANILTSVDNGLTGTNGNAQLGGALTKASTITTSPTNYLALAGLQTGTVATDDVMLINNSTGALERATLASLVANTTVSNTVGVGKLSTTVNGVKGADVNIDNSLTSTGNQLTSIVAGGNSTTATIINSNTLTSTGGKLISTVNTVATPAVDVVTSADNGLTVNSGTVKLGGTLTASTTIATAGKNLAVTGLPNITSNQNIVTLDPTTGVLSQRSPGVFPLAVKTADYTITLSDYTVVLSKNATSDATFTLPNTTTNPTLENGRTYRFVNLSTSKNILFSENIRTTGDTTNGITAKLGFGTSYIDGNMLGNKITIQWDATDSEWIQVGN